MEQLTTIQSQSAGSDILAMIEANPDLQPTTKAQYTKAVAKYLATGRSLSDAEALASYAARLPKSSRAFLKAAVLHWTKAAVLQAQSLADPTAGIEEMFVLNQQIQSVQYKAAALVNAIQVETSKGSKAHTWLTQAEVKRLLDSVDQTTPAGQRDRLLLGLLVGAGLRREELAGLTFADVILQPLAGKFRTVLNVTGKGDKDRIVPINDRLAAALDSWRAVVGAGAIARSIAKGGAIGDSLSAVAIFNIVRRAGEAIGKPDLAPHDLRRTYAQLGYEAGVPITQISKMLGHSSVTTTQRYLNLDIDLESTISDFIPF